MSTAKKSFAQKSTSTLAAALIAAGFVAPSFAMDYTSMQWEYTKQDDTGAAKGTVASQPDLSGSLQLCFFQVCL